MSTVMDNVAGKGRTIGTNVWIWLLLLSLLVFAGNTIWATTKAARLGGASTAASNLQVNSQRLANQGREAVGGNAESFAAFKTTRQQIDSDIKLLNDRFGQTAGVAGPINAVTDTWAPLARNADNTTALIIAAGLATRSPGEDAGTESEVLDAVQVALDLGIDINAVDNNGETAMHGAAYKNLPKVVKFLAAKGARIGVWNRPNKYGWIPLAIAVGYRFGNFKPSPVTEAALREVMIAAGVTPPSSRRRRSTSRSRSASCASTAASTA